MTKPASDFSSDKGRQSNYFSSPSSKQPRSHYTKRQPTITRPETQKPQVPFISEQQQQLEGEVTLKPLTHNVNVCFFVCSGTQGGVVVVVVVVTPIQR